MKKETPGLRVWVYNKQVKKKNRTPVMKIGGLKFEILGNMKGGGGEKVIDRGGRCKKKCNTNWEQ